jgi:hypothetical protein
VIKSRWKHERDKKFTQSFVGKPEEKSSLERPRHRWEDTVFTFFKEIGWEGVD